jgi:REP element-mobilizing transposase RayT
MEENMALRRKQYAPRKSIFFIWLRLAHYLPVSQIVVLTEIGNGQKRWWYWLFDAKKRSGLSVLNYVVTSNHIHLLVRDRGHGEIAKSMPLIAGRTAPRFNRSKNRKGAFWEDRYHPCN